ncbi:DUF4190 domain-containing protein [Cryptosporangium aurantiacum]|uniref:DUF4190 domain-containing protein n=1 Tax=Cryptosporangium aurantiacum TaxID=134849 RepID=A0A1M7QQ75_9ACTN|nr:DUF4190 domain-containing protein [Cryptosporangium aurantiacum]SHN33404.1 protein of unknown function [Cryptosporangium aurantiacum]
MTTNPPPGEANPWAKPTSGFPDPTSAQPAPTSGYPDPTSGYPATPAYDANAYAGYPPAGQPNGYPPAGAWGAPPPGYPGYPPPRKQNGMALASMIVSICSLVMCGGLPGIVGALIGHSARKQIRQTGEEGASLATVGIIVGWIGFGLGMAVVLVYAVLIIGAVAFGWFDEPNYSTY